MRKRLFLLLVVLSTFFFFRASAVEEDTRLFTALLITFPEKLCHELKLQVQVKERERGFSEWAIVTPDLDEDEHDEVASSGLPEALFQTNESTDYRYRWINALSKKVSGPLVQIEPFRYGKKKTMRSGWLSSVTIPDALRIIGRDEWGANENLLFEAKTETGEEVNGENNSGDELTEDAPKELTELDPDIERVVTKDDKSRTYEWPLQYAKNIKFIVIHHTASQKNLDNPEVAIQNIYFYHAVRKKWGDIGYNFLIDPNGKVYEGRFGGDKIVGGHAKPINRVSVGIGVLGNYEEGEIPVPVMRSLLTLTNFLSKKYNIDPDGSTVYKDTRYRNIQGHRDNSKTLCPGRFLYQKLFGVRDILVDSRVDSPHVDGDLVIIPPESERKFEVKVKNLSNHTWNASTKLRLFNPELNFEDLQFITSGDSSLVATLQNFPVAPDGTGIFEGKIKSSLASGLMLFQTYVEREKSFKLAFFVQGVDPSYEIILRHDPKNLLSPGEQTEGYIELKNTGNVVWKRDGPHRIVLSASQPRNRKSIFFGNSNVIATLQQTEVKPGEIGRFEFHVRAPASPGTYTEYFLPIIEGIRALEDKNLSLSFEVRENASILAPTFPIRIKLSFEKSPKITSENRLILLDGEKVRKIYPAGTILTTRRLKNGIITVAGGGKLYRFKGQVRIKPHLDGVLKIVNWDGGREFRGVLEVRSEKGLPAVALINELPLEDYVKGIAEEPNDAPYEKIKTIAILARSYAQFYMTKAEKFPGKPYHLDDDPRNSQKYLGYSFEKRAPNVTKAAEETIGQVLTYQGNLIKPPYFSESDGRTRSAKEVFGWKDTPYLVSVPDPDCAGRQLRGHGVGLSGCGAKAKAKRGETAEQIIKYYYTGVEILGRK